MKFRRKYAKARSTFHTVKHFRFENNVFWYVSLPFSFSLSLSLLENYIQLLDVSCQFSGERNRGVKLILPDISRLTGSLIADAKLIGAYIQTLIHFNAL